MKSELLVRPARPDELVGLAEAVASQPLFVRYGLSAEKLATLLTEALGRGEPVRVAACGERALGFAWFQTRGTLGVGGYLRLIAVVPGEERKGIGEALMAVFEAEVATVSRHLFLLVSDWNQAARAFYGRRGYAEVGRLPGFVRPDIDEILCWKRV